MDKELRVIILLLAIGFIADSYSVYLNYQGQGNFAVFNWFFLTETLLLFFFFFRILTSIYTRIFIGVLSLAFVILWIKYYLKTGQKDFIDIGVTFENISIIVLSILYYFRQLNEPDSPELYSQPRFWVVSAYLIYVAGTFFLFLYLDSLPEKEQEKYYNLNYILTTLKCILLGVAMFMKNDVPKKNKFQLT